LKESKCRVRPSSEKGVAGISDKKFLLWKSVQVHHPMSSQSQGNEPESWQKGDERLWGLRGDEEGTLYTSLKGE